MTTMPLFSYPTTIGLIDDDQLFLKALSRMLSHDYLLQTFQDSYEALNFFESYKPVLSSMSFLRGCPEYDSYDAAEHMPVDLNAEALMNLRKYPERCRDISVLVVDYNMPNMNGLELCRKLYGLPIKKILLTGAVDHTEAVEAFNEGLIDRFVRKDNPRLIEEIQTHLIALMRQNFIDNTRGLLSHLEADHPLPISDSLFSAFFKNWCATHNISEHFLLDKQGNFILVDNKGEIFYFIVHTDKTLSTFVELHEEDEEVADLINAVSKRKLIPFFGPGKEPWQKKESEWSSHFYVPEIFEGKEKYFWTAIKGNV